MAQGDSGSGLQLDRKIFHTLDGMRGVAALAVVERHKPDFFFGEELPASYLAVDLFFVLSGFVVTFAYAARLEAGMGLGRFTLARLVRLYPLYLLATILSTLLFFLYIQANPGEFRSQDRLLSSFATAAFFLPTPPSWSINPDRIFPLNEPGWSLFFEILANLAFALLILRLHLRGLLIILAVSALLLVAAVVANGNADIAFDWRTFAAGFPRVTFSFFMGVLLFRLWRRNPGAGLFASLAWPLLAVLATAFALPLPANWRPWADAAMILVLFPLLVHMAAHTRPGQVSQRIFAVLGASSYGVYVFHMPLARAAKAAAERVGLDIAALTPWFGFAFMGGLFMCALAAHHVYDVPVRRWLTGLLNREGAVPSRRPGSEAQAVQG